MKGFLEYVSKFFWTGLKGLLFDLPRHILLGVKKGFVAMLMAAVVAGVLPSIAAAKFFPLDVALAGILPIVAMCMASAAGYTLIEEMNGRKNSPMLACVPGLVFGVLGAMFILLNFH